MSDLVLKNKVAPVPYMTRTETEREKNNYNKKESVRQSSPRPGKR